MPERRLIIIVALLAMLVFGFPASAQDNLLRDPGFEGTAMKQVIYDEASGTRFSVSADWNGWYTESPHVQDWQNLVPNGTGRNNTGAGFVRSGGRSAELSRGYSTFTAALYQTVGVPAGSNVVGSAWYVMDLSLNDNPNSRARVGIDPNGGTNPYDSDVVWSAWGGNQIATNGFKQLTVQATATANTVTLFLFATQTVPSEQNGIFWDDAQLYIGGSGGANAAADPASTPVPAATPVPQTVPNVVPQGAQDDGSIVHSVQPGDTINSIAVAYGVSSAQIIELNNLANPRLISVGQRLLIVEGSGSETADDTETDSEAAADTGTSSETDAEETTDRESASESEETEEPTPEPTATPAPTSTPVATSPPAPVAEADTESSLDLASNVASLCVMIYDDANGDTTQQNDELAMPGGVITLQKDGAEVDSFVTSDSPNPSCFTELEPGQYIVDAGAPAGYTLLPSGRSRPNLPAGQEIHIAFAAVDSDSIEAAAPVEDDMADDQETGAVVPESEIGDEDDDSLLQYIGLAVFALAALTLVGGVGLGLALRRR